MSAETLNDKQSVVDAVCGTAAHVVVLPHKGDPVGASLSAEVLAEVVEAGKPWRDEPYVAKRLEDIRKRHNLGGIVLARCPMLQQNSYPPPNFDFLTRPIQPFEVNFEPVLLNETDERLLHLMNESPSTRGERRTMKPSAWKRTLVRFGGLASLVIMLPMTVQSLLVPAFSSGKAPSLKMIAGLGICLVAIYMMAALSLMSVPRLFLVPGGVVRRSRVWDSLRASANLFTPTNVTVIITPLHGVGWLVRFFRGKKCVAGTTLTDLECLALLATWTSGLTPPDGEKLSDLR